MMNRYLNVLTLVIENSGLLSSLIYFLKGYLIGFLASMPVGAIAIMSVQRTMNNGLWAGFTVGLGAAIGDFIYATVAGFSIGFIKDFIEANKIWLSLAGGIFLIFIGYKIFRSDTVKQYRKKTVMTKRKMANDFISSLLLALSNPVTIGGFTGFFASAGIMTSETTFFHIAILLVGVLLGALSWWFAISFFVNKYKKKITLRKIVMINRISGILIVIFGIAVIIAVIIFKDKVL